MVGEHDQRAKQFIHHHKDIVASRAKQFIHHNKDIVASIEKLRQDNSDLRHKLSLANAEAEELMELVEKLQTHLESALIDPMPESGRKAELEGRHDARLPRFQHTLQENAQPGKALEPKTPY